MKTKYLIQMALFAAAVVLTSGMLYAKEVELPDYPFKLDPKSPRHCTVLIEFRDQGGEKWPNLFVGKPSEAGQLILNDSELSVSGVVLGDRVPQSRGNQGRRVLGELFTPEEGDKNNPPVVTFTYTKIADLDYPAKTESGKEHSSFIDVVVEGVLQVNDKSVSVQADTKMQFFPNRKKIKSIRYNSTFTVSAADLGLTQHTGQVGVRVFVVGYPDK